MRPLTLSPAAPSRSHAGDRPNDDASTPSPLANPASSLPESVSAPNRDALSGLPINVAAHAATANN